MREKHENVESPKRKLYLKNGIVEPNLNEKERGITLIALVITIIILIILSAVAINAVIGENGLIQRAQGAAESYDEGEKSDTNVLDTLEGELDAILGIDSGAGNEGETGNEGGTSDTGEISYAVMNTTNNELVYYIGDAQELTISNAKVEAYELDPETGEILTTTRQIDLEKADDGFFVFFSGLNGENTTLETVTINIDASNLRFSTCSNLKYVTINEETTIIPREAFVYTGLIEINLPDTIEEIGQFAFEGCTSLNEIEIPSSVISINSSAFSGCTSLSKITVYQKDSTVLGEDWVPEGAEVIYAGLG